MKTPKLFALLIMMTMLCASSVAQTSLQGKVTEAENGEPVIFGNVVLYQNGIVVTGVETDFDGNYKISNIDPGTYDVEAAYLGFNTVRIANVLVKASSANKLDIQMEAGGGINLDEVIVKTCCTRLMDSFYNKEKSTTSSDEPQNLPTKDINGLAATSAGVGSAKNNTVSVQGSRSNSTNYYINGVRVQNTDPASTQPNPHPTDIKIRGARKGQQYAYDYSGPPIKNMNKEIPVSVQPTIAPSQLTAGEWKDLDNWTFWQDLKKDNNYNRWQKHWSFFPENRYSVKIIGLQNQPIIDCSVALLDAEKNVIWEAKTDNQGRAELWTGIYGKEQKVHQIQIKYGDVNRYTNRSWTKDNIQPFAEVGINQYQIPVACETKNTLDILFAVDATGSMGDEIDYLKAELKDVIGRAKENHDDLNIRLGAVFYRDYDHAPEIRAEVSPFSENINDLQNFIDGQRAIGGRSTPEAVDLGLEKALGQDWSREAVSRILFLILDAPPHHKEESIASIQNSIEKAARMGIKIIPITASGIQKDTEFLMKYFSVITNSSYCFLTDHSGIGNSHIKPTAGSYNVETLNDMMLRLILENTETSECKSDTIVEVIPTSTEQMDIYEKTRKLKKAIKVFPNPAKDQFTLELKKDFDLVLLFSKDGRLVRTFQNTTKGKVEHNIQDIPPGMYFLQCIKGEERAVEKLVVVKD